MAHMHLDDQKELERHPCSRVTFVFACSFRHQHNIYESGTEDKIWSLRRHMANPKPWFPAHNTFQCGSPLSADVGDLRDKYSSLGYTERGLMRTGIPLEPCYSAVNFAGVDIKTYA